MEIESLLSPVSPDYPSGIDLDSDAMYADMSTFEFMVEGEVDPRDGKRMRPKWVQIVRKGIELSQKGKHLRVAAMMTQAAAVTEGFSGLADGLRLIRGWCEKYWDSVYPLEERRNSLAELNGEKMLTKSLLGVVFAPKDPGEEEFSYDAFIQAWDGPHAESSDSRVTRLANEMFSRADEGRKAAALKGAKEALEHAKAIEDLFDDAYGAGSGSSLNFADLRGMLAYSIKMLETGEEEAGTAEEPGQPAAAGAAVMVQAGGRAGAMTRASAIAMLDQVIKFFEATEPSSPVPYLLQRAKRCVGKNFMDLIEELSLDPGPAENILKSKPDPKPGDQ